MHGKWAIKSRRGGFKPEEATDKLTCPYVGGRGVKGGGEEGGIPRFWGIGVELNLVNVGVVRNQAGREGRVRMGGGVGRGSLPTQGV